MRSPWTGALGLFADPTSASQAATKRYVDAQIATALPVAGGTIIGSLSLTANPTANAHVVNRQYVDDQVAKALSLTGGTLAGALVL
jgi:hypothetical protein